MSTLDRKSNLWNWNDPRCPLGVLRVKWTEGATLGAEEIEELQDNGNLNPDSRIRKSAGDLLNAIAGRDSGHAAHLMETRNFQHVKRLITQLP